MTSIDIAWTISFVFWLIFTIAHWNAENKNNIEQSYFYYMFEIICLGFMWIFIGFDHGWW